jgi:HdeA/HdeB family
LRIEPSKPHGALAEKKTGHPPGTAPVQAKDAGEWTCEDFLKVPKSAQPRIVYYLVGFNKSQMKEFNDISAKDFNVSISKVVQHCHSNLPWQAIADHVYWHAMQMP